MMLTVVLRTLSLKYRLKLFLAIKKNITFLQTLPRLGLLFIIIFFEV